MNKKYIILSLSAIIIILAGAVLYFMISSKSDGTGIAPSPEKIKPTFIPPSNMPPLSVVTDKTSYGTGERVKISVRTPGSKNIPPFRSCSISIKRTENRTSEETSFAGLTEKYVFDESSTECKEHQAGFIFDRGDSDIRHIEWDQRSCENGKIPVQSIPDDYSIIASCNVPETEGYSGPKTFSDATNISLAEDASCNDKKIAITEASYDRNGILSVKIENAGAEDIGNVRIYLDKCDDNSKTKFEKDLGPLSTDRIMTKTITTGKKCKFSLINAHIGECYDRAPERWANSNIKKL